MHVQFQKITKKTGLTKTEPGGPLAKAMYDGLEQRLQTKSQKLSRKRNQKATWNEQLSHVI